MTEATMADKTSEAELLELEHKFWQTMITRDVETAVEMTAEPSIVTGAQGVGKIDHEAFRGMMKHGTWKLHEYNFDDVQTVMMNDDVGIIAYKVTEKLTVDGKPLTMQAADASTWVRKDGKWVCALHTESVLGDPFGRDRVADQIRDR
jgi:hypothetical protein